MKIGKKLIMGWKLLSRQVPEIIRNIDLTGLFIAHLLEGIKTYVDETTYLKIIEAAGKSCAWENHYVILHARWLKEELDEINADMPARLNELNKIDFLNGPCTWDGEAITLCYDKCCCVFPEEMKHYQSIICSCAKGYIKAILEPFLGKELTVETYLGICEGDDHCEFKIRWEPD